MPIRGIAPIHAVTAMPLPKRNGPVNTFRLKKMNGEPYIFNSKDLCLLDRLPELVAAGVNSLKIEGRMKPIFYVGGVVRIYRAASIS